MRSRHIAWLIAATLGATACHTLAPLTFDEVASLRPARVWVTDAGKSVVEVSGPQIYNDTLVGYVGGAFTELPAADIKKVVMKRPARAKTIALFAGATVGAAALMYLIAGGNLFSDPKSGNDCDDDPDLPACQGYMP